MPQELYNEGRVVGYSAYEVYVKQHANEDPNTPPATERQWLASSLAMGSSMLLKLPASPNRKEDENWIYEAKFPNASRLCAVNTVIASFFKGDAPVDSTGLWATRVSDYGDLISNTSSSSPNGKVGPTGTVPSKSIADWPKSVRDQLRDYMKIVDGIVIQPGTWTNSAKTPPQKDFNPDLSEEPRIRLHVRGPIKAPLFILFTGFTIRTVVSGVTGLDSATNSPSPEDGDFLGPGQFPWSNRIVFSVPTSYVNYFQMNAYKRKLPTSAESKVVNDTPVVDMKTTQPETYYNSNYPSAREPVNVLDYVTLGDGTAVLTVYQRKSKYPPAIWGTYVDSNGTNYLNPLDVVAPGTVKMFNNATQAELNEYQNTFPGTHAVNRTDDGELEVLDKDGNKVPAASVRTKDLAYNNLISSDKKAKGIITTTGKKKELSLSVGPGGSDSQYTISSPPTSSLSPTNDEVYWAVLLEALANNKGVDILGKNMKAVKAGLPGNYIQFPNGLRLYISPKKPPEAGVPVGSIGIGWEE